MQAGQIIHHKLSSWHRNHSAVLIKIKQVNSLNQETDDVMSVPHDNVVAEDLVPAPMLEKRNRWNFITSAVQAMKKWKEALNPKYVYGQQKEEARQQQLQDGPFTIPTRNMGAPGKTSSVPVGPSKNSLANNPNARASSARASSARGRTTSDRPSSSGVTSNRHHGHKGRLIFKPLPDSKKS